VVSRVFCLFLFLSITTTIFAEIAGFSFSTEAQEQRFRELAAELRCLVCQNQSLADSNADLAQDLRTELYRQIVNGNSDDQIISFMTGRYGEFVLYKPRFSTKTILLWLAPFLLFIVGVISIFRFSRLRNQAPEIQAPEAELQKIRALLETEIQKK